MPKFTQKLLFILSFSICSHLLLASCNSVPEGNQQDNSTSNSDVVHSTDISPQRNSYNEIDLNQLPENISKKGNNPQKLALTAFGAEAGEGLLQENVEIDTSNPKQAIVTITQANLPDDSLKSIRYRVDLIQNNTQWEMEWAGQQFICQPERGNQNWSKNLCY